MANVSDAFNRADAGSLGTADSGQTWANFGGGSLGITSNAAQTVAAAAEAGAEIDGAQADATWQVTVLNAATGAGGGLVFRKSDDLNWWVAQIIGGTTLYTRKYVAGVYTDVTNPVTFADGDVLSVVTSGNSITVKVNGSVIRTLTDAFNATATKGGILSRASIRYDTFSITGAGGGNTNPTASITAPANGSTYTSGTTVNFTGTGTDTEDGTLPGTSLSWSSSINGALGTGTSISTSALSVGTHTITLTATDSGGLTGTASITVTVNAAGGGTPTAPTLPQVTPTRISISGLSYASSTVVTAATLQATIDAKASLAGHHEIIVQDGQLITTPVVLPTRTNVTGYIVIRSQTMPSVEGIQAHPSMITTQAEFRTVGGGRAPVISMALATGVQKYILAGLYVTESAGNDTNMLVELGQGGSSQNSVSLVPEDLQVDRCVMRGDNTRRALALHSGTTRVVECWLSGSYLGSDSQAIHSANGTGPYLIEHNYLEGAGENVMFGGQSTFLVNVVPTDITFRLNTLSKPLTWFGHVKSVKNIFELKIGHRVLVEGNFFEHNWLDEQSGMAVLIKSVDQEHVAPWLGTADVTVRYNFTRKVGAFCNLAADPEGFAVDMERVAVHDNVAVDVAGTFPGGDERSWMVSGWTDGGMNYRIFHNTVVYKSNATQGAMAWLTYPLTHFFLNDNIDVRDVGSYGVRADALAEGNASFNGTTLGSSSLQRNVITGSSNPGNYPATNYFPANAAAVGFVTPGIIATLDSSSPDAVCAALTLAAGSAYKGVGDSGSDPGANMTNVRAFLPYTYVPGLRSDDLASFVGPSANPLSSGSPVATALATVNQPDSIATGAIHASQPTVEIQDQFGARLTSDTSTVTAALVAVTGSGTAIGTLTKAAVAGLASFVGLGVTSAGGGTFKWRFTDGTLTLAESNVFTVAGTPIVPGGTTGGGTGVRKWILRRELLRKKAGRL